ncbi:MAG: hypothetical protein JW862_04085 [Anaerolineales bacterium]|nr:hypothetical protein [Anaerolineales bacterium]
MKQDRFLIAILVAIGLLAVAALVLFFARPQEQSYGDDSTPAGVVRNYVLALQQNDYEKAYEYLSTDADMPTASEFRRVFLSQELDVTQVSVQIQESEQAAKEGIVKLVLIHGNGSPFQNSWHESTNAVLVEEQGAWKIVSMPYPYWYWDWYTLTPPR